MRSRFFALLPALILSTALLVSCSKGNDPEPEKGAIDTMTGQGIQADRDSVIDDTVQKQ